MSRHEHFTQMLARRAELSPQEELDLQQHLRDCPECRQTADVYARQAALLRTLPLAEPPPTLRAKVLGSIQQPPPHRVKSIPRIIQAFGGIAGRPFLLLAPFAAALLIVAAVFAFLNRPHHANNSAIAPTAPQVRSTVPTPTPTPQRLLVPKPTPTATPARRKKRQRPSPSSTPSAQQPVPVATPVPGVNAPILSQALPTPTTRELPASPRPRRKSSARSPSQVTAPRPTPVATPQPTSTATPAPLPPGVHPIALGGTAPPARILPPTPAPPTVPAAPVRGAPTTPTPAPASAPPPPPPSPVAAPVAPVTTPTPIP